MKLRIVDRYLARELFFSFAAAAAILLLVTVGATVADLLAKIARGRVAADLLLALVGLRTVDALSLLLPLAAFLGVQIAYGRLYRESEMAVFAASGLPAYGLMRPLAWFGVPLAVVLALVAFWLGPAAVRQADALQREASRSLIVAGLEPGRFVELPNRDGIIYVEQMNADGSKFSKLFLENERRNDKRDTTSISIVTAPSGELFHDADGSKRFLGLNDGFRVEGTLGQDNWRLMRFARNDIELPDNDTDSAPDAAKRSAPTTQLWSSTDLDQRVELQWRMAAPVSLLVLVLLGLPLAKSNPREPRYARLLIALLAWFAYYNILALGRAWMTQGRIDVHAGFWWLEIPVALIALFLIWRGDRLPKPRAAVVRRS
jgi:lipopolysaccharide export system permease protein